MNDVPSKSDQRTLAKFNIFPILVCLAVSIVIGRRFFQQFRIETQGIITNGTAISVSYKPYYKGSGGYTVYYVFDYNSDSYSGKSGAVAAWARSTVLPAPIRIKFVPSNPTLSEPLDGGVHNPLWFGVLFTLGPLAIATYLGLKSFLILRSPSNQLFAN